MKDNPRHFLILDDEESIRHSISAYMEDEGYVVFQASSGEEALELLARNHIENAVVDIRLPGMDGNMFMLEARKIIPGIKFVVHTGSADYYPPKEIRDLGVRPEDILIKPASDLKVLCDALKNQSGDRKDRQS
jgi:CheY-like chemotaxis protein